RAGTAMRTRAGRSTTTAFGYAQRSATRQRQRAELVERSFAHILDRGGMRRTWLRGRKNVHKRYLIHVAGHNLGLLMRLLIGAGTPKEAVASGWCVLILLPATDGAADEAILRVLVPGGGAIDFPAFYFYAYPAPPGFAAARPAPGAAYFD